jgi:hypothetical protein
MPSRRQSASSPIASASPRSAAARSLRTRPSSLSAVADIARRTKHKTAGTAENKNQANHTTQRATFIALFCSRRSEGRSRESGSGSSDKQERRLAERRSFRISEWLSSRQRRQEFTVVFFPPMCNESSKIHRGRVQLGKRGSVFSLHSKASAGATVHDQKGGKYHRSSSTASAVAMAMGSKSPSSSPTGNTCVKESTSGEPSFCSGALKCSGRARGERGC